MLSDERLEKVERLVSKSLNEDASLQKVCSFQPLTTTTKRTLFSDRNWCDQCSGVRRESEHIVLHATSQFRSFRQIVTPFSTSLARHTRRTSGTSMRYTIVSPRSITCPCSLYIRSRGFCLLLGREILARESYPGVSLTHQCKRVDACLRTWNWRAIRVPALISPTDPQLQKKRNARMKDALEEALILSYS
jgi:hypothetical protein